MEQLGKLKRNFLIFVVSFFGTGLLSKKMPGTIGSIFATLILVIIPKSANLALILSILTFIIGWIACKLYIPKYESDRDPGYIVIDEACGIFLGASILYSFCYISIYSLIGNLIFFRIFDIWKPFPIRNIEKLMKQNEKTVAFGIMIDDVIAALIGTFCQTIIFLISELLFKK